MTTPSRHVVLRALTSSLWMLVIASCSSETAPTAIGHPVSSVEFVAPPTQFMVMGNTQQLSVIPKDAEGDVVAGTPVEWESSDDAVATVSATGLVTAVSRGVTAISATTDGRSASFSLRVAEAVGEITIENQDDIFEAGASVQLVTRVRDAQGVSIPNPTLTWSSSSPSIASVSTSGLLRVSGSQNDSIVVSATVGGKTGRFRLFAWPSLTSDIPIAIDGVADKSRWFVFRTTPGAAKLTVTLSGGSGDADLYVWSPGTWSGATQMCESVTPSTNETCVIDAPQPGLWSVEVYGYSAFGNVSLRVR